MFVERPSVCVLASAVWCHGNNTEITRNPLTHDAKSGTLTWGSQPRGKFEIKDPNKI